MPTNIRDITAMLVMLDQQGLKGSPVYDRAVVQYKKISGKDWQYR